jgi:hypothetical protein
MRMILAVGTWTIVASVGVLVSGCASLQRHQKSEGGAVGALLRESGSTSSSSSRSGGSVTAVTEPVLGKELRVNRFDYPVVVNQSVEKWVTYFQGKGARYFAKYLERGRYFIPEIAKTLKANDMPQDLVYLAMIESGFNNSAKSHARAVGPWQFIRPTGKRYGLHIDYWLDERRDTRRATTAAIAYLKELYQEFGSWELAAAAYNAGEGKIRRAIAKYKTNDFWEIRKRSFLKRETRDYVPKIMAAAIITKNPELFGFEDPFQKGTKPIENPTVLLLADGDDDRGDFEQSLEPTPKELGEEVAKAEDTQEDEIASSEPSADEDKDLAGVLEEESDEDLAATHFRSPSPTLTPSVYMVANPNEQITEFEVKGPADLFAVSKAAGVPFSTVRVLNPELLRWCTPPYLKTYRIKLPSSSKDRFLATYNDDNFDRKVVFTRYTVRRGDNVQKIARRFGIEADPIRDMNKMARAASWVREGTSLVLPVPTGYKRVIASMYDDKPTPARRYRRKKARRYRKARTSSAQIRHYRTRPSLARSDTP